MTWGRLDDMLNRSDKWRTLRRTDAGHMAGMTWIFWLSYCLQDDRLDGFVPASELNRRDEKAATELVSVGLWEAVEGGFHFHDFEKYAMSPEALAKRRADDAKRKRDQRERDAVTNESQRDMQRDSHPQSHRDPGIPVSRLPSPDVETPSESLAPPSAAPDRPKKPRKPKEPAEHTDTHKLRTAFEAAFLALYGHAATWNAACGAQASRIVKQHGLAECGRRLGIYFNDAPHWMTEGSRDFLSFARFFDKLAIGASGGGLNGTTNGTHRGPFQSPGAAAIARGDRFGEMAERAAAYEARQRALAAGGSDGSV